MTTSDVVSLIDQYEVIARDHAVAIVDALARKGVACYLAEEGVPGSWAPEDVHEGQLWMRDDRIFEVVAITGSPTVTLREVTGDLKVTFEISSADFSGFQRLRRVWSDGSADT